MGSTSKPQHIKLKDSITGTLGDQRAISQDPGRTTEKDKAAAWLIENVVETGEWPLSYNELEERSDWSAGHFRNVYTYYFEPATDSGGAGGGEAAAALDAATTAAATDTARTLNTRGMTIDVPDTVSDMPSFIAGISVGYKLALEEDR